MTTNLRFLPGLRKVLGLAYMPAWASRAACARVMHRSRSAGYHWSKAFADDLGQIRPDEEYRWGDKLLDVMKVCATCPVRAECTAYAYEVVDRVEVMESPKEADWGMRQPKGVWVDSDLRYGVLGGLPGPQRERFADTTCPQCEGSGFTDGFGRHQFIGEQLWPGRPGFPCPDCQHGRSLESVEQNPQGSGRVPDPDRVQKSMAWFDAFARDRGWELAGERQEVSA